MLLKGLNFNKDSVYVDTRISLRRNIENSVFPKKLSPERGNDIADYISAIIKKTNRTFMFYDYDELFIDKKIMLEDGFLRTDCLLNGLCRYSFGRALAQIDNFCVVINGHDHIVMELSGEGENFKKIYEYLNSFDDKLNKYIDYAFDEKYGYLTSSINDLGTGMRAGATLMLPELSSHLSDDIISEYRKEYNVIINPVFSLGFKNSFGLYDVFNAATIGNKEEDIIDNVKEVAYLLCEKELEYRKNKKSEEKNELYIDAVNSLSYLLDCSEIHYESVMDELAQIVRYNMYKSDNVLIKDNDIIECIRAVKDFEYYILANQNEEGKSITSSNILKNRTRARVIKDALSDYKDMRGKYES